MPVLFVETLIALGGLVLEIARRRRIRHQDELHALVGFAVGQPQKASAPWRGKAGPTARASPNLAAAGSGQVHGVPQRLAEVFLVVIAGQRQDRPALAQERLERLLQMADRLAQTHPAPANSLNKIAGDEQDIDFFRQAIIGHALDGLAQIVRAIDATEAVGQVPVGGVQNAHEGEFLSGDTICCIVAQRTRDHQTQ